jgi:hypothetical protein
MAQIKGVEAATTTFNDTYAGLPGDLATASTRLPGAATTGCGGVACVNGTGDGVIGAAAATPAQSGAYAAGAAGENVGFWLDLSAAGLISGVSSTALTAGGGLPAGKVGGLLVVSNVTGAAYGGGTWITLGMANVTASLSATGPGAGANALTPNQAAQIDRKQDDGIPQTGTIISYGQASCTAATYTESTTSKDCGLSWRIQQ